MNTIFHHVKSHISGKWKPGLFLLTFLIFSISVSVKAQDDEDSVKIRNVAVDKYQQQSLASQVNKGEPVKMGLMPQFFEHTGIIGSPYLIPDWVKGAVEFSDHRVLPRQNEYLGFSYDKYHVRLYIIDQKNKISSYPIDSITEFVLTDSNYIRTFEKVPVISRKFFLEPIVLSAKGYCLYKRIVTTLTDANYHSEGYYSVGSKHDEYKDYDEYYLLYPDKESFRKFYLDKKGVRKGLGDLPVDLDEYLKTPATEHTLIEILEKANDPHPKKNKTVP
jgi:hypothetical protein